MNLKFRRPYMLGAAAAALSLSVLTIAASADDTCGPAGWLPDIGQPGMIGIVAATMMYNSDLIAAGEFVNAGWQKANNIARWDGVAWHPLTAGGQTGVDSVVLALTAYNGDLIAGGEFTTAGGQTVNNIARWDGAAWHPLTSGGQTGVNGRVFALTVHNGSLVAGGEFTTAGGQTVNRIARWDGEAWHPISSGGEIGVSGDSVGVLTVYNGSLVAGGFFATAGGQTVNNIARWDGAAWHPFMSGGETGVNDALIALTEYNGDLMAGGEFTTAGGQTVNRIARWDGAAWHPLTSDGQTGVGGGVLALTVSNSFLVAGGTFITAGGEGASRIARWSDDSVLPTNTLENVIVAEGETAEFTIHSTWGDTGPNQFSCQGWCFGQAPAGCWCDDACLAFGDCCFDVCTQCGSCELEQTYKWRKNGVALSDGGNISGATTPTLTSTNLSFDDVAAYDVQVQNQCGTVISNPAALAIGSDPSPPSCIGDLNDDGVVIVSDLLILLGNWGVCPE